MVAVPFLDLGFGLRRYGLPTVLVYILSGSDHLRTQLFLAPLTAALLEQQYAWVVKRTTVHMEAIFTQLLLEHALRMRVISEVNPASVPLPPTLSASAAPSAPVASPSPPTASKAAGKKADGKSSSSKSSIGRINNLISSDMRSLATAADVLEIMVAQPLGAIGSVVFLSKILGWRYACITAAFTKVYGADLYPWVLCSALAGFGLVVATTPIPVAVSKRLQGASRQMAKKVLIHSCRVSLGITLIYVCVGRRPRRDRD